MIYLALLPQFIDPAQGSVLRQSLVLGVDPDRDQRQRQRVIALAAGSIARFLAARPSWLLVQRYLMGTVLAGLAVRDGVRSASGRMKPWYPDLSIISLRTIDLTTRCNSWSYNVY